MPLRAINVLIGANGSGKSNFIGVFSLLRAVRDDQVDVYLEKAGGADRILHFGSQLTRDLKVRVTFRGTANWFELYVGASEEDRLVFTSTANIGDRMILKPGKTGMADFIRDQLPCLPLSRHERDGADQADCRPA